MTSVATLALASLLCAFCADSPGAPGAANPAEFHGVLGAPGDPDGQRRGHLREGPAAGGGPGGVFLQPFFVWKIHLESLETPAMGVLCPTTTSGLCPVKRDRQMGTQLHRLK